MVQIVAFSLCLFYFFLFGIAVEKRYSNNPFFRYNPSDSMQHRRLEAYPTPTYCVDDSTVIYTPYNNKTSIMATLFNCLYQVQDAMISPVYTDGRTLNVSTSITLNNLISIHEMTNEVRLDLLLFVIWEDPRLQMPALWAATEPQRFRNGVDLTQANLVFNVQGLQPGLWEPDIIFPDATEMEVRETYTKLYPNGQIRKLTHMTMTLAQPNFHYDEFPCDKQTITIRYSSFTLLSEQLKLMPISETSSSPLYFTSSQGSKVAFGEHPVWSLGDYWGEYVDVSPQEQAEPRSTVFAYIEVVRKSRGVLRRLGIPILLLVILAALAFWADPTERENTTVTLLLALAAMYLVIFSTIPMVGNATLFDSYVLTMFILLFGCSALHQLVCSLRHEMKASVWPLRKVYIRVLEFLGRVFVIPFALSLYLGCFSRAYSRLMIVTSGVFIAIFIVAVSARDIPGIRKSIHIAFHEVGEKANADKISTIEVLLFNLYQHRVWSTSIQEFRTSSLSRATSRSDGGHFEMQERIPS
jgi:hypothetical protein